MEKIHYCATCRMMESNDFECACGKRVHETISAEHAICIINTKLRNMDLNFEMLHALKWFVKRVEEGEVRSKKTYKRFKDLIKKVES